MGEVDWPSGSGITGRVIETRRPVRRDLYAARYGGEVTVTKNGHSAGCDAARNMVCGRREVVDGEVGTVGMQSTTAQRHKKHPHTKISIQE